MAGPVALITGASSGFGALFAQRFAAHGYDVVLVARREDRLRALAAEIENRYPVTATVVTADLTDPDAPRALREHPSLADVAVVVNNAGFGTAGTFVDTDPQRIADEVAVNVVALTAISRLFLPDVVRNAGVLLNISSTAGYQPIPGLAVYAATKAYVRSLTEAIWKETRGTGARVLAFAPGPSETEFFEAAGSRTFKMGQELLPAQIVDRALKVLDRRNPPPSAIGGWRNALTAVAATHAPRRLMLAVVDRMVKQ